MPRIHKPVPTCIRCKCAVFAGETYCHRCRNAPVAPIPVEPMAPVDLEAVHREEAQNAAPDLVNLPPHYQSANGIECIDAIEAALTPEEFRGFCKGNALKYTWREKHKGRDQDLAKAAWYLNRLQKEAR